MRRSDREGFWRQHVQSWRDSELSGSAYCRQAGISLKRFYFWRKRFAHDAWLPVELEKRAVVASGGAVRIVLDDAEVIVDADSSPMALRIALDALS